MNGQGIIIGYFFGPRYLDVPRQWGPSTSQDAILVDRFGDMGLRKGQWELVGRVSPWNREEWPVPSFGRIEPLTEPPRAWKITYGETLDQNSATMERISLDEARTLPKDGLIGPRGIEKALSRIIPPDQMASVPGPPRLPQVERVANVYSRTHPRPASEVGNVKRGEQGHEQVDGRSEAQAVIVHLQGNDIEAAALSELEALEDLLEHEISRQGVGEYDGNEIGQGEAWLFMYGPDADRLFSAIEPILRRSPLASRALVKLRYGGPGERDRKIPF